jgi:hypothetical protein
MTVVDGPWTDDIDFAMLHKIYGSNKRSEGTATAYSPAVCTGIDIRVISGNPDRSRISTSCVERQNLAMRMGMRRCTRLTNGFSKEVEFNAYAVSLDFMYSNHAGPHSSLRVKNPERFVSALRQWQQG